MNNTIIDYDIFYDFLPEYEKSYFIRFAGHYSIGKSEPRSGFIINHPTDNGPYLEVSYVKSKDGNSYEESISINRSLYDSLFKQKWRDIKIDQILWE